MSPSACIITDSGVFCRAPYEAARLEAGDEAVLLKVGAGEDMEEFWVAAKLLSNGSEYFEDRLAYRDADMLDLPIAFPRESPADFRVFITFLETGSLRHPNLRAVTASGFVFRFLAELYAFAGVYKADAFRNAILDAFFLCIMAAPRDLPYEQVQDVYKHTRDFSSLRDLIIDVIVNMGTSKEIRRCMGTLKKDFLLDCLEMAAEDCVVPFQKPKGWLERKADRMCREYHVHSEEELRAPAQLEDDEMEVSGEEGGDRDMEEFATTGHDEEQDEKQDDEPLDVSDEVKQQMQNLEDLRKLRIHY